MADEAPAFTRADELKPGDEWEEFSGTEGQRRVRMVSSRETLVHTQIDIFVLNVATEQTETIKFYKENLRKVLS